MEGTIRTAMSSSYQPRVPSHREGWAGPAYGLGLEAEDVEELVPDVPAPAPPLQRRLQVVVEALCQTQQTSPHGSRRRAGLGGTFGKVGEAAHFGHEDGPPAAPRIVSLTKATAFF